MPGRPGEPASVRRGGEGEHRNVAKACELLEVSRSAFHDWHQHRPSARALADEQLGGPIQAIFEASRGTYGWPPVHRPLLVTGATERLWID